MLRNFCSRTCRAAVGRSSRWIMMDNQDKVPRLPVPALEDTVKKFVEWTSPLLDENGRIETQKAATDFLNGPGPLLHQALLDHAARPEVVNWMDDWWTNVGYLQARVPNPLLNNYAYAFEGLPLGDTWTMYAARITYLTNKYKEMIDNETLPAQMERDAPLCMLSYKDMFGTNRVPRVFQDELRFSKNGTHILVMFRGNLYKVEVAGADVNQIYTAFNQIVTNPSAPNPSTGVGIFTCIGRDDWAKVYAEMEKDPQNCDVFKAIDTAMWCLCLDDVAVTSQDQHGHLTQSAADLKPFNRWYDKNFCYFVTRSGHAGMNGEHSWGDGFTTINMLLWVLDQMYGTSKPKLCDNGCKVEPMKFNMSTEVLEAMPKAEKEFQTLSDNTPMQIVDIWEFGTKDIKKLGVSPDAFVQVAMMITAHETLGTFPNAYESVMTKRFVRGRTEAGRQMTAEAAEAGKVWVSPTSTDTEKAAAVRAACKAHVTRIGQCKNATGVDRHLFGLAMIQAEQGDKLGVKEVPAIFSSPGKKALATNTLSTSTLGGEALKFFCFGPVEETGFGLPYVMKSESLHFPVAARKFNPAFPAFPNNLRKNLLQLHQLLQEHK
eukprot:TRINITY_DN17110_c0_g1_i1.p1 TRINITY_DN17110_c0_g1~~TRINITY_DN17110_c0_g1_i1.p1  ORF type:complete len:602 (-),score=84.48 TRINITY_DN17110_c0_g1_i1:89-1894(-)